MRLALQTVVCWCVLLAVLPLGGRGGGPTTLDFNSTLKKRFRLWLQSRVKRDVRPVSAASGEEGGPEIPSAGTQQQQLEEDTDAFDFLFNLGPNNRSKRSGCKLALCTVHDLYHRLSQLTDKSKQASAPAEKIKNYGRRRRSSQPPPGGPEKQNGSASAAALLLFLLHGSDGIQHGDPCCSGHHDGAPEVGGEASLD